MSCEYALVEGDTGSVLQITCKDQNGNVIDLSGATVILKWRDQLNALQQQAMSIISPATNGQIKYQFGAGEIFPPAMYFSVKITDSSGGIVHSNCVVQVPVRSNI